METGNYLSPPGIVAYFIPFHVFSFISCFYFALTWCSHRYSAERRVAALRMASCFPSGNLSCQFWMLWLDSVCVCHTHNTVSSTQGDSQAPLGFRSPCQAWKFFLGTELRQSYNHSASRIYFPSFKDHCSLFLMTRVLWTIVPYEEMFVCFRINSLIVIPRNGESGGGIGSKSHPPFLRIPKSVDSQVFYIKWYILPYIWKHL